MGPIENNWDTNWCAIQRPPPPPRPSFELRAQPSTPAGCQSEFRHTPRRVDWLSLRPGGTLPQLAAGQRRASVAARWGRTPNGKARSLARGRSQGSTEQCRPPPSAGASGRAGPQSKRIRWEGRACERPARQSWPSTAHTSRDVIGHQVQTPPLPLRARWSAPPSCPLGTWGGAAGRTVPASTPPSPGTPLLRIERNAHQCALRTHARAMVCGSAGHDHPRVWTVVWGGGRGEEGGGPVCGCLCLSSRAPPDRLPPPRHRRPGRRRCLTRPRFVQARFVGVLSVSRGVGCYVRQLGRAPRGCHAVCWTRGRRCRGWGCAGGSRRAGWHWQTPLVRLRGAAPPSTATSDRASACVPCRNSLGGGRGPAGLCLLTGRVRAMGGGARRARCERVRVPRPPAPTQPSLGRV